MTIASMHSHVYDYPIDHIPYVPCLSFVHLPAAATSLTSPPTLRYDYFVKGAGLDDDQCLLYIHSTAAGPSSRLAPRKYINSKGQW